MSPKGERKHARRTAEERIRELEARIAEIKRKEALKAKKEHPVLKEIPKLLKRLRSFAQLAADHERFDIANSTTAFQAGLARILQSETETAETPAPLPPPEGPEANP